MRKISPNDKLSVRKAGGPPTKKAGSTKVIVKKLQVKPRRGKKDVVVQ